MSKLDAIGMFYQNYFHDVEQLFFDLHYNRIDDKNAMERLRQLRKLEYGKETEFNKYVRKCSKKDIIRTILIKKTASILVTVAAVHIIRTILKQEMKIDRIAVSD